MKPPELLFWGDVGFDVYDDAVRPGGCALNASVSARRAGCDAVGVAGVLGADGAPLRALLAERGIADHLAESPRPTPRQPIRIAPDGERTLHDYQPGALSDPPSPAVLEAVAAAGLVHLPVFDATLPWAELALARRAGRPLGLDLMDLADVDEAFVARAVRAATVVIAGLDAGRHAGEIERLRALAAEPGAALVIVTLGAQGALAVEGDQEHRITAAPVPGGVVDTTGCGDAFAGTFLGRRALGDPVSTALAAAAERAARVAGHLGAIES